MAKRKVIWTKNAEKSFQSEFNYLKENWSEKEIIELVQSTESFIEVIAKYPYLGRKIESHRYLREVVINPKIILLYKVYPKQIALIEFWNTKKDCIKKSKIILKNL